MSDVDEDQRLEEVGDLGPADATTTAVPMNLRRRRWRCAKAARTPPRSSAASPRAVVPPGRGDRAPQRERVVVAGAQQLGGARHRLRDQRGGERRRHAAPHRGVDLRLDEQRPVGRARRRSPRRRRASALRDVDHRPERGRTARAPARAAPRPPARRARRRRARRGARSTGVFGSIAEDRRVRVGGAHARPACVRARSETTARAAPAISCATAASWAGLWARTTQVGALGELAVGGDRLAADLRGERTRAAGAGVRAQHRLPPPERERAGHVA